MVERGAAGAAELRDRPGGGGGIILFCVIVVPWSMHYAGFIQSNLYFPPIETL